MTSSCWHYGYHLIDSFRLSDHQSQTRSFGEDIRSVTKLPRNICWDLAVYIRIISSQLYLMWITRIMQSIHCATNWISSVRSSALYTGIDMLRWPTWYTYTAEGIDRSRNAHVTYLEELTFFIIPRSRHGFGVESSPLEGIATIVISGRFKSGRVGERAEKISCCFEKFWGQGCDDQLQSCWQGYYATIERLVIERYLSPYLIQHFDGWWPGAYLAPRHPQWSSWWHHTFGHPHTNSDTCICYRKTPDSKCPWIDVD